MKHCLSCGEGAPDEARECDVCGRSFAYTGPIADEVDGMAAAGVAAPQSALRILGAIFYVMAGVYAIWAIFAVEDGLLAIVWPIASFVASLFFGAMSFAADDIRSTLRSIDRHLSNRVDESTAT